MQHHWARPSKVDRLILEEASEWFVDFRVGDVDGHARERFDQWLRRSPEHIRAYVDIARTYVELPLVSLTKMDVDSLIAYAHSAENVVSFNDAAAQPDAHITMSAETNRDSAPLQRPERTPRPRRRSLAAAMGCALALTIAGAFWWQAVRFPTYATSTGERLSITLSDGSTVELNARSRLRVQFSKKERNVELLEGQALFQVAKEKTRPFIVSSVNARVRAVGTQFDVYRRTNGTTVTVLEGRVAVYSAEHVESTAGTPGFSPSSMTAPQNASAHPAATPFVSKTSSPGSAPQLQPNIPGLADPSDSAPIFLSAGEQVTVTPEQVALPQRADIAATTAWMERRLIFDGARLSDVIQEFNRDHRRQLIVEGSQLSDFRVSGVYSSGDPSSLIRFLRDQPGLKITEGDNEIRISPR
jgi:transmembrane sensor